MSASKKIHVCFVIPMAYSLYNTRTNYNFGGAEVRSSLFIKALAKRDDFKVSVVVNNHGQSPIEKWEGVTVYAHTGYYDSAHWISQARQHIGQHLKKLSTFPYIKIESLSIKTLFLVMLLGLRRLYQDVQSRLSGSKSVTLDSKLLAFDKYAVYDNVDADVYCVFGTRISVSEIVAFCKARKKKFILFGASDRNFTSISADDPMKARDQKSIDSTQFIIESADEIVTQTTQQAALVQTNFGKDTSVIRNPVDLDDIQYPVDEKYVLWIGRSHPEKAPKIMITLAQSYPDVKFVMIMNKTLESLHAEILAHCPENVTIVEQVAYDDIEEYFANALIVVNTSPLEGFPNTFLQAGKYAKPLLTLAVDPDGYITENECGIVAHGEFASLKQGLEELLANPQYRKDLGANHYQYVKEHHNLNDKVEQLAHILKTVK